MAGGQPSRSSCSLCLPGLHAIITAGLFHQPLPFAPINRDATTSTDSPSCTASNALSHLSIQYADVGVHVDVNSTVLPEACYIQAIEDPESNDSSTTPLRPRVHAQDSHHIFTAHHLSPHLLLLLPSTQANDLANQSSLYRPSRRMNMPSHLSKPSPEPGTTQLGSLLPCRPVLRPLIPCNE
jgi:hypothetical protein